MFTKKGPQAAAQTNPQKPDNARPKVPEKEARPDPAKDSPKPKQG